MILIWLKCCGGTLRVQYMKGWPQTLMKMKFKVVRKFPHNDVRNWWHHTENNYFKLLLLKAVLQTTELWGLFVIISFYNFFIWGLLYLGMQNNRSDRGCITLSHDYKFGLSITSNAALLLFYASNLMHSLLLEGNFVQMNTCRIYEKKKKTSCKNWHKFISYRYKFWHTRYEYINRPNQISTNQKSNLLNPTVTQERHVHSSFSASVVMKFTHAYKYIWIINRDIYLWLFMRYSNTLCPR